MQGIKAVREEVATFITQRDGPALLPAADPEQVHATNMSTYHTYRNRLNSLHTALPRRTDLPHERGQ